MSYSQMQLTEFQFKTLTRLANGETIAYIATDELEMAHLNTLVLTGYMQDATEAMQKKVAINTPWRAFALTEIGLRLFYDLDSRAVN